MNDVENRLAEYYASKLGVLKKEKELSDKLLVLIANFLEKEGVSKHLVSIDVNTYTHRQMAIETPKHCLQSVTLKLLED